MNQRSGGYNPAEYRRQQARREFAEAADYHKEIMEGLEALHPEQNAKYSWTDLGSGNLFADLSRDHLRYVPERKKWYFYDADEGRWKADIGACQTMTFCKAVADGLMAYAVQIPDERLKTGYLKYVAKWQGLRYRETVLKDASTVAPVAVSDFDSDPYLFNCQNGILDLHTESFREHDSADLVTRLANVEYVPDARCERWEQFMDEVTCGDKSLARFLQKAVGYSLSGGTDFECFFLLYGPTSRNGKSTLIETILTLLGDYGRAASPETIAQRKYSDSRSPSEDVARLAGVRFVAMSEPGKNMILSAETIKTLTGNDTIHARFLGENGFDYKPQFKIFVGTNHLPYINDSTVFTSGRIKVLPFNRHFEDWERNVNLKHELTTPNALSGILNWAIEGWQLLRCEGLQAPQCSEEATKAYADDSDKLQQFIEDCLIRSPRDSTRLSHIHRNYQDWCYANGLKPEGLKEFKKSLASAGFECRRMKMKDSHNGSKAQMVLGLKIKQ